MGVAERRARERESIRQDILDAARVLFVKEGYEATSIRKIAQRAEYSPGTIYLHFEDKQAVLEALGDEMFFRLDRRMEAIENDEVSDPLERLRRGLRVYIQFGLENPHHYCLVFMLPPEQLSRPMDPLKLQNALASFQHLVVLVEHCMRAGKIPQGDSKEYSQALWAGAHGITSLLIAKCGFPFVEQERLIERVVTTLIDGVRA